MPVAPLTLLLNKTFRAAMSVKLLPSTLVVMAPDTVMSRSAATVCKVLAPLKLLAATDKDWLVLSVSALLLMAMFWTLLPVFVAVNPDPLANVTVCVLALITPLRVMAPEVFKVVLDATVMAPELVAVLLLLLAKAPAPPEPVPFKVNALATDQPLRSKVPPALTVMAPWPKGPSVMLPEEDTPAFKMPLATVVVPA